MEKGEQAYLWPAFLTWDTQVSDEEQTAPLPQRVLAAEGRTIAEVAAITAAKTRITAR